MTSKISPLSASQNWSFGEWSMGLPIALIFALLVEKIINLVLDTTLGTKESLKKTPELYQMRGNIKFISNTIAGLVGVILGIVITRLVKGKLKTAGTAISYGGSLIILYTIYSHWNYMDDVKKLITLLVVLGSLIFGSYFLSP